MSDTLKKVLTVSILLNILLLGVLAGFINTRLHSDWFYSAAHEFNPESRHLAARIMRKTRNGLETDIRRLHKTRDDIMKVLQADDFDSLSYEHNADKLRSTQARILDTKLNATKELALALPDKERQYLAGRLAESLGEKRRMIAPWYRSKQAPKPEAKPE